MIRWVSAVQFVSTPGQGRGDPSPNLLLTSSNDSTVVLWDLSKQEEGSKRAKQLTVADNLHSSGIFSMHGISLSIYLCS